MSDFDAAILLDNSTPQSFRYSLLNSLRHLVSNPATLSLMSKACFRIGDGLGLSRLVFALADTPSFFVLRNADYNDINLYFYWANDPSVRSQSLCTDPISFSTHQAWFKASLKSPNTLMFLMQTTDGLPIGQIRFTKSDSATDCVTLSYSLDRIARGRRLSSRLISWDFKR